MRKIISLLLLVLFGCSGTATPTIPPTAGDFVKNTDGVGTAQVFGIDFSIHVNAGGVSSESAIDVSFVDPAQARARKRFTLGDDVTIQLDSVDESQVQFMFNDQNFGNLNVRDKVKIDAERNVEVNGTLRSPTSAPSPN